MQNKSRIYRMAGFIAAVIFITGVLFAPTSVYAAKDDDESKDGAIVLDGLFDDWTGEPQISDADGDELPKSDLVMAKWLPDSNTSRLYLYCERLDGTASNKNNPGAVDWDFEVLFTGGMGKTTAYVAYHPESRQVTVKLLDDSGTLLWSSKGKWGEDKYTANRVELYIPYEYLAGDIQSGYQFNMSFSSGSDRTPDNGCITVSTASTFPWLTVLLMGLWVILLVFLDRRKMHFFKFIVGSIGLFIFLMILGSAAGESFLESAVAQSMGLISQITHLFNVFPDYSLITVYNKLQAVSFIIDYECSGFIEILVFLCLLLFYPMFRGRKKILCCVAGGLYIFAANLVRLTFICVSIKTLGTSAFFLSHTILARVLFFILMIILYYYVFTRPHIMKQKVGDLSYD